MEDGEAGAGYLPAAGSNEHILQSTSQLRESDLREFPLAAIQMQKPSNSKINIQENHATHPISQKPSQKSMRKGKAIKF